MTAMIARHRLRALAERHGCASALGGPLPHGRRIALWCAGGAIVGERDESARWRGHLLIGEDPAALSNDERARLSALAIALAEDSGVASTVRVDVVLDDDGPRLLGLAADAAPECRNGVTLAVTLTAGEPAATRSEIAGRITGLALPNGCTAPFMIGDEVRLSAGVPLATFITSGRDRETAVRSLRRLLAGVRVEGLATNLHLLRLAAESTAFGAGLTSARDLDGLTYQPPLAEVIIPGTHTTVQDCPGRLGYWAVGVPPSGPMDDLAFRLANHLVGNPPDAAGLEATLQGPELRFLAPAIVCLAGPAYAATIDGVPLPQWQAVTVAAGARLRCGGPTGPGCRASIAIRGGIDVPAYLGSRATFDLGGFGGHAGRPLQAGDLLPLGRACGPEELAACPPPLPGKHQPHYARQWEIGVLEGPHAAPDFLTPAGMRELYATRYTVHHNSNRTGVRLIGPKPCWARTDGGEAGLHPSNLHDNAYAVGAIDLTGDMPILLGPDGPSCGGFVCPAVTVAAERWKLGQLRPGDTVQFMRLTPMEAAHRGRKLAGLIAGDGTTRSHHRIPGDDPGEAVLARSEAHDDHPGLCLRRSGDEYLLLEYGQHRLDLVYRLRVHLLHQALVEHKADGVIDITPGIRSLQVHVDSARLPLHRLADLLLALDDDLPAAGEVAVPSRTVHLPLSWDDPATQKAIDIYSRTVRKDAPWCPSNLEFIRRINGLASIADVKRIVYDAEYLVLGLGDVYLGAPVATPIDPRHRLVTTKYNPARTWTPPNAVGIGGAYLCIYGMEGPGGYQFVGRTVPVWNSWKTNADFQSGSPWLLRCFDRIKWYEVGAEELMDLRADVTAGRHLLRVEDSTLRLADRQRELDIHAREIADFRHTQRSAFATEREHWKKEGL